MSSSSSSGQDNSDASMETVIKRIESKQEQNRQELRFGGPSQTDKGHCGNQAPRRPQGGGRYNAPQSRRGASGNRGGRGEKPTTFVDRLKMQASWNGRDWPPPVDCPFDSVAKVTEIEVVEDCSSSMRVIVHLLFHPPAATRQQEQEIEAFYHPLARTNKPGSAQHGEIAKGDFLHCKITGGVLRRERVWFANDAQVVKNFVKRSGDEGRRGKTNSAGNGSRKKIFSGDDGRHQPRKNSAGGVVLDPRGGSKSLFPSAFERSKRKVCPYVSNNNNYENDLCYDVAAAPNSTERVILPAQSISSLRNRAKTFFGTPARLVQIVDDEGYLGFEVEDGCKWSIATMKFDAQVDVGADNLWSGLDVRDAMVFGQNVKVDAKRPSGDDKEIVINKIYLDKALEKSEEKRSAKVCEMVAGLIDEIVYAVIESVDGLPESDQNAIMEELLDENAETPEEKSELLEEKSEPLEEKSEPLEEKSEPLEEKAESLPAVFHTLDTIIEEADNDAAKDISSQTDECVVNVSVEDLTEAVETILSSLKNLLEKANYPINAAPNMSNIKNLF